MPVILSALKKESLVFLERSRLTARWYETHCFGCDFVWCSSILFWEKSFNLRCLRETARFFFGSVALAPAPPVEVATTASAGGVTSRPKQIKNWRVGVPVEARGNSPWEYTGFSLNLHFLCFTEAGVRFTPTVAVLGCLVGIL
jgi:hypothetical protein